jgi:Flp pilus assembly protein CpaB
MSTVTLPRAAAKARRIDFRVVVGLLLFVLGVVATSGIIRQAAERSPVLVAARPLEAGQTVEAGDLQVAEVGLVPGVATVGAEGLEAVIGQTVRAPLEPGQILAPGTLASGLGLDAGEVAISVGLHPARAAGGTLRAGDRVIVLATSNPDRPNAATSVLLSGVEVLAVQMPGEQSADPNLTVTLAVPSADAAALAQSQNSGLIDLVLLPQRGTP